MGFRARILTLTHFLVTFGLAIVLAVGFASNNWVEATFLKQSHGVTYTSGLFLGCFVFINKSGLCSKKIVYGSRATFNLNLNENPDAFLTKLVKLSSNMELKQPVSSSQFTYDEEFFDEGKLTFTNIFTFYDVDDSDSIFCARYMVAMGLIVIVLSAMFNFFLSCVYSVKATKVFTGIYLLGCIMITMGSNIMYIPYIIDSMNPNPELVIGMGFGMVLTIIGVAGLLFMSILLSLTLLTVEKAKIKDEQKTTALVNRATMMTLTQTLGHAGTMNLAKAATLGYGGSTLGGQMNPQFGGTGSGTMGRSSQVGYNPPEQGGQYFVNNPPPGPGNRSSARSQSIQSSNEDKGGTYQD